MFHVRGTELSLSRHVSILLSCVIVVAKQLAFYLPLILSFFQAS
jgi:hypothetical protein